MIRKLICGWPHQRLWKSKSSSSTGNHRRSFATLFETETKNWRRLIVFWCYFVFIFSQPNTQPTKYHYYPHHQQPYFLPECAIQQVSSFVTLKFCHLKLWNSTSRSRFATLCMSASTTLNRCACARRGKISWLLAPWPLRVLDTTLSWTSSSLHEQLMQFY